MQSHAERVLVARLCLFMQSGDVSEYRLLNVGAGTNTILESIMASHGCRFVCDRLDVDDCNVVHPNVGKCVVIPAESMEGFECSSYDGAFSNYVLEHVTSIADTASQIARVLKPGGIYIASIPNPTAPEFLIARFTPLGFHRLIRRVTGHKEVWETRYAYRSVGDLVRTFERAGLECTSIEHFGSMKLYLNGIPILSQLSTVYDCLLRWLRLRPLMGNVCVAFRKKTP